VVGKSIAKEPGGRGGKNSRVFGPDSRRDWGVLRGQGHAGRVGSAAMGNEQISSGGRVVIGRAEYLSYQKHFKAVG